jgi:hypothetical protein
MLARRDTRSTAFQHPEWLRPWWPTFKYGRPHVLACFDAHDTLVGLGAFVIAPESDGGGLRLMGMGNTDRMDVLVDPAHAEVVRSALWDHVAAMAGRGGAFFRGVPAHSPLASAADSTLASWVTTVASEICPVVPLPQNPEAFTASCPPMYTVLTGPVTTTTLVNAGLTGRVSGLMYRTSPLCACSMTVPRLPSQAMQSIICFLYAAQSGAGGGIVNRPAEKKWTAPTGSSRLPR